MSKKVNIHKAIGISEFYEEFKSKDKCSKKEYSDLLHIINSSIAHGMLWDGIVADLKSLGKVRINKKEYTFFREDGELKKSTVFLAMNYQATKKLWQEKYPDLTQEELQKIPNKPIIRYMPSQGNGFRPYLNLVKPKVNLRPIGYRYYKMDLMRTPKRELNTLYTDVKYNVYYPEDSHYKNTRTKDLI